MVLESLFQTCLHQQLLGLKELKKRNLGPDTKVHTVVVSVVIILVAHSIIVREYIPSPIVKHVITIIGIIVQITVSSVIIILKNVTVIPHVVVTDTIVAIVVITTIVVSSGVVGAIEDIIPSTVGI